jgi:arylsulfatase A-like enzyme
MTRPNILFAIADDASHFGCFGNAFVDTPAIDALGKEGVLFTQAFTTNPKCGPSRACILTGMYTWKLKEGCDHFGLFPENVSVFPDLMEKGGYRIGYTGKGWEPGDWKACGRQRNPAGNQYDSKTLSPPEGSKISCCDYAGNFHEFLDEDNGQPFFFWYGGREPHRPYGFGEAGGKEISPSSIPPYWPDSESIRQDMRDYAYEISWFDKHLGAMVEQLRERGILENTLIVVTSDNGAPFPRVKGQMYEDDFHLPVVVSWKNHVKKAFICDKLVSFIDFFPTFLDYAEIQIPTDCDGKSLRGLLESSEQPWNREYTLMGKERHDVGREHDFGYPVRCLRTSQYLYVWNLKPDRWPAGNPETGFTNCDSSPTKQKILQLLEEGNSYYHDLSFGKRPAQELYDILKDPHCMHNLFGETEFACVAESLRFVLLTSLYESKDPRMLGNGDCFDTYEYVGNDKHSWRNYINETWEPQDF